MYLVKSIISHYWLLWILNEKILHFCHRLVSLHIVQNIAVLMEPVAGNYWLFPALILWCLSWSHTCSQVWLVNVDLAGLSELSK